MLSLIEMWMLGLAVLEFRDRFPSVGDVGSGLALLLKLSGAVKMDRETFIEAAAQPFELLHNVHVGTMIVSGSDRCA